MMAMTQRASIYARAGQRGGRPEYAAAGMPVRCRATQTTARRGGARGMDGGRSVRLLAECAGIRAGDRLVLEDGTALVVSSVRAVWGHARPHHLEIEAISEG